MTNSIRHNIKYIIGMILYLLSPAKIKNKVKNHFSLGSLTQQNHLFERLMRYYLANRLSKSGNINELAKMHQEFWKGESGVKFHEITQKNDHFKPGDHLVAALDFAIKAAQQQRYTSLIEIGCGNGDALNYISEHHNGDIQHFIGLDLSHEQIEWNKKNRQRKNIEYIQGDAVEWFRKQETTQSLIMTHMGVLEYFTEEMVKTLFGLLAGKGNALLLTEPIDHHVALQSNLSSFVFGSEYSISHNYPHLLKICGFDIRFIQDIIIDKWRMLVIVAVD